MGFDVWDFFLYAKEPIFTFFCKYWTLFFVDCLIVVIFAKLNISISDYSKILYLL